MPDNMQEFLQHYPWVYSIVGLVLLILAALFANTVVKSLLLRVLRRILDRTAFGRDEEIRRHGLIERLASIVPAFVIFVGIRLVPGLPEVIVTVARNVASAVIILMVVRSEEHTSELQSLMRISYAVFCLK